MTLPLPVLFPPALFKLPIALLTLSRSAVLDRGLVMKRLALPLTFESREKEEYDTTAKNFNEWIYNVKKSNVDEDEEEDEDDEDEDD